MADWMQRLTDWTRNRRAPTIPQSIVATPSVPKGGDAGEYRLLFRYLRDRYANRVVLTFSEIEDLLGFELPEGARRQQEWWASAGSNVSRSAQSDSWTLASRTATVNMAAQNVLFERDTSLDVR